MGGRPAASRSAERGQSAGKGLLSDVFAFDEKVRETQDIRAKIYGILSKVGFEGHESLSIRERQHVELLKLYPECRVLETWLAVGAPRWRGRTCRPFGPPWPFQGKIFRSALRSCSMAARDDAMRFFFRLTPCPRPPSSSVESGSGGVAGEAVSFSAAGQTSL